MAASWRPAGVVVRRWVQFHQPPPVARVHVKASGEDGSRDPADQQAWIVVGAQECGEGQAPGAVSFVEGDLGLGESDKPDAECVEFGEGLPVVELAGRRCRGVSERLTIPGLGSV